MMLVKELEGRLGTMAALHLLSEQPASKARGQAKAGALIQVCGSLIESICQSSEPLSARPGDLPFVFDTEDRLHEPFLAVRNALQELHDHWYGKRDLHPLRACLKGVKERGIPLHEVRLLLYVAAAREWLGECKSHAAAIALSEGGLRECLELAQPQERLLLVFLDSASAGKWAPSPAGLSDREGPIRRGYKDAWTEMACNVMAVAAALPGCMFHTMGLNLDAINQGFR
eukprot:Hpha_TRINITY_DN15338_c1_g1::TRINITY_DN15338_c1_g1_i1::g.89110::m.89110